MNETASKICPQCKTIAPLDAAFCAQCGRQYRTQFATAQQPKTDIDPVSPDAQTQAHLNESPSLLGLIVGILCIACLVAIGILKVNKHTGPLVTGGTAGKSATMGLPQKPPAGNSERSSQTGPEDPKSLAGQETGSGDHAQPKEDDTIPLRGGGSITKKQWEEAAGRVRDSGFGVDPPPPPVPKEQAQSGSQEP